MNIQKIATSMTDNIIMCKIIENDNDKFIKHEQINIIDDDIHKLSQYGDIYVCYDNIKYTGKFYWNLTLNNNNCNSHETCSCGHVTKKYNIKNKQSNIIDELVKTQEISSPFLINYYDVVYDIKLEKVVLKSELYHLDLSYIIRYSRLPITNNNESDDNLKLEIIQSICQAVNYLHEKNIIHENIQMINILLTFNKNKIVAKLGGFLISNYLEKLHYDDTDSKYKNTQISYFAPEILHQIFTSKNNDVNMIFTKESDIYALGILINEIITFRDAYSYDRYSFFDEEVLCKKKRPIIFNPNISNKKFYFLHEIINGNIQNNYCPTENNEYYLLAHEPSQ